MKASDRLRQETAGTAEPFRVRLGQMWRRTGADTHQPRKVIALEPGRALLGGPKPTWVRMHHRVDGGQRLNNHELIEADTGEEEPS